VKKVIEGRFRNDKREYAGKISVKLEKIKKKGEVNED